jgi:hypothetical protein
MDEEQEVPITKETEKERLKRLVGIIMKLDKIVVDEAHSNNIKDDRDFLSLASSFTIIMERILLRAGYTPEQIGYMYMQLQVKDQNTVDNLKEEIIKDQEENKKLEEWFNKGTKDGQ